MLLHTDANGDPESSNRFLFDLYMMIVEKPRRLWGLPKDTVKPEDDFVQIVGKTVELYADSLTMSDTFGVRDEIDTNELHRQIWRRRLEIDLDSFINAVSETCEKKYDHENVLPEHKDFDFTSIRDQKNENI